SVGEFDPFAFVAQRPIENPGDRRVVILFESFATSAKHQETLRLNPRAWRELEFHPSRERPATQIDRLITGVVQLDVLQVFDVVRGVIENLVDHDARLSSGRKHRQQQEELADYSCQHSFFRRFTLFSAYLM